MFALAFVPPVAHASLMFIPFSGWAAPDVVSAAVATFDSSLFASDWSGTALTAVEVGAGDGATGPAGFARCVVGIADADEDKAAFAGFTGGTGTGGADNEGNGLVALVIDGVGAGEDMAGSAAFFRG